MRGFTLIAALLTAAWAATAETTAFQASAGPAEPLAIARILATRHKFACTPPRGHSQ